MISFNLAKTVAFTLGIVLLTLPSKSSSEDQIPGEPLNPDDFEAGRIYFKQLESGQVQEPPENPDAEIPVRSGQFPGEKWSNGMVPYQISEKFSPSERAVISSAISDFKPRTCLVFAPRMSEKDYVQIFRGDKGGGCYSFVGKTGGAQTLQVGVDCMRRGSVIHEFLHAAGFAHEHQRIDRDEYIEFDFKYIKPDSTFPIINETHNTLTPYDYGSILHYSERAFCKQPCPQGAKTILKKKDDPATLGQRNGMSQSDLKRANMLYNCASIPNSSYTDGASGTSNQATDNILNLFPVFEEDKGRDCRNLDRRCSAVRASDCRRSTWVNFTCRKTCRHCGSGCRDYHRKCQYWSRRDECQAHPEYMLIYCRFSCGGCQKKKNNGH